MNVIKVLPPLLENVIRALTYLLAIKIQIDRKVHSTMLRPIDLDRYVSFSGVTTIMVDNKSSQRMTF